MFCSRERSRNGDWVGNLRVDDVQQVARQVIAVQREKNWAWPVETDGTDGQTTWGFCVLCRYYTGLGGHSTSRTNEQAARKERGMKRCISHALLEKLRQLLLECRPGRTTQSANNGEGPSHRS